jgi:hypothetical protein
MRGNKYKISKKRRLRRRGKYSKKLKPKSRKGGGRFFGGHEKNKVTINATCDIPAFFFDIDLHRIFCNITYTGEDIQQLYTNGKINISVDGDLVSKKADKGSRTLSVNLRTAFIKAFFNSSNIKVEDKQNPLTIDVALTDFDVIKRDLSYSNQGIYFSRYTPLDESLSFTCKDDKNDNIMKSLLHLWRKAYNPTRFKTFDVFFRELSSNPQYHHHILNQFRNHEYIFNVEDVLLSSS